MENKMTPTVPEKDPRLAFLCQVPPDFDKAEIHGVSFIS